MSISSRSGSPAGGKLQRLPAQRTPPRPRSCAPPAKRRSLQSRFGRKRLFANKNAEWPSPESRRRAPGRSHLAANLNLNSADPGALRAGKPPIRRPKTTQVTLLCFFRTSAAVWRGFPLKSAAAAPGTQQLPRKAECPVQVAADLHGQHFPAGQLFPSASQA